MTRSIQETWLCADRLDVVETMINLEGYRLAMFANRYETMFPADGAGIANQQCENGDVWFHDLKWMMRDEMCHSIYRLTDRPVYGSFVCASLQWFHEVSLIDDDLWKAVDAKCGRESELVSQVNKYRVKAIGHLDVCVFEPDYLPAAPRVIIDAAWAVIEGARKILEAIDRAKLIRDAFRHRCDETQEIMEWLTLGRAKAQ